MKIGGIDVVDFIEKVPVLRLFAKNLALSGGLAFIIQDFLIPLYASYIFFIVIVINSGFSLYLISIGSLSTGSAIITSILFYISSSQLSPTNWI